MKKYTLSALLLPLLSIAISTSSLTAGMNVPANTAAAPANNFPPTTPGGKIDFNNVPPMSPEELAKWEEEVTKEINEYVNTLSPEEQAQFNKEVEELTNVMSKMSPDELVKFIDTMLTEEGQQPMPLPQQPTAQAQPEVEEKPVEKPVEKKPELPIKSVEAALNLIDDLIMHIERFLRKSNMIPELPGTIEKWVSKNKIREWKNNLTWEILKADIEALNKQLNRLKDRDPKTKNYLYLSKLIEQESLYNNLIHIKQALVRHEPHVEAPAFGLGTVTPQSHEAIKQVLSILAETIYTLHVPTDINKVLGSSAAREQELKAEEEKNRKTAYEHSKRPQTHETKRETIMPQQSRGGYGTESSYPSYGAGSYPSQGSYPYADSSYYGPNAYSNTKPSTNQPGKSGSSTTPGKETETKPGENTKTKGAEGARAEVKLDDAGKNLVTKIDKALEKFADSYLNSSLQNIYNQLVGGAPMDTALQDALGKAQTSINNALDLTKKLKTRGRTNQSPQAAINDALRDVTAPYKDYINKLINQISTLKTAKGVTIPPAVDTLYTALTDFNKEVGLGVDRTGGSMPSGVPVKAVPTAPGAPAAGTPAATPVTPVATTPAKSTAFDTAKNNLDNELVDIDSALKDPKITGLRAHIMGTALPDTATAQNIKDAMDTCRHITTRARNVHNVLVKLPAAEQKKIRHALRADYAQYTKLLGDTATEVDGTIKVATPPTLGKGYLFFGMPMDNTAIAAAYPSPADAAKVTALQSLLASSPTRVSLADFAKALQDAKAAIENI